MAPSEWARYRSGADVGKFLSSKMKWWVFVALRLFQVPVNLAAIGVAEWTIKTKLPPLTPTIWTYGLVCGCITASFLFYLVPATMSNRVPGAGHGGIVPPIIDFIGMLLWLVSWISLDRLEKGIQCSGLHQDYLCFPYTAFKALGCWNFALFLIMGCIGTAKWYKAWKDPRMDRFGMIDGLPYGSDGLPTFTLPTAPELRGRFGDELRAPKKIGAELEVPEAAFGEKTNKLEEER